MVIVVDVDYSTAVVVNDQNVTSQIDCGHYFIDFVPKEYDDSDTDEPIVKRIETYHDDGLIFDDRDSIGHYVDKTSSENFARHESTDQIDS